ncbi:MAG TPA: succinate dehydrogenase flavoprotein subunit, partial [Lentibacillus sp.]|nr:succinate dehydrogenase flavoprotein subunit [Lentibacillus sp.]
ANRLGANSLLSAIYGGSVAGPKAIEYIEGLDKHVDDLSSKLFEDREKEEHEKFENLMKMDGTENAYQIHKELGELMTDNVTVVRYNDKLKETDKKIQELMERWENININDTSRWNNQGVMFTRQLESMLHLARVITNGALKRDETRGAHYKPEFPERDDENFLKTTIAQYDEKNNEPVITYEDVDVSYIAPRKRDYTQKNEHEGSK